MSLKHGTTLKQAYPNAKTAELLLYYNLSGHGNKDAVISDYLATNQFENDIYEYETEYLCIDTVHVNDPYYQTSHRWSLDIVEAYKAWAITTGSPEILIGIADTEFDTTQEDLQNKFAWIYSVSTGGNTHGTKVSTIAAASTNNGLGMASIGYNSRIAAHSFKHTGNSYNPSDAANAIWNLYLTGTPIINLSGTGTGLDYLAVKEITENGTVLILAGGNSPASTAHSNIANIPGVIVVSSLDKNNKHATTGDAHNQWIDICAPAKGVLRGDVGNIYAAGSGTSIAAPFVAGTIALMLEVNPHLTPAEIEDIIKASADPIADEHLFPGLLGAGKLNAYKSVKMAGTKNYQYHTFGAGNIEKSAGYGFNLSHVSVLGSTSLTLKARKEVKIEQNFKVTKGASFKIIIDKETQSNW